MHFCFLNLPIEYYSPICGGAISTIIMESTRVLLARGHDVSVLTIVNDKPTYEIGDVIPLKVSCRSDLSFFARRISSIRGRLNGWDWPYYESYRDSFVRALAKLSSPPDAVIAFNDLVCQKYIRRACPHARRLVWLQNECRTRHTSVPDLTDAIDYFLSCSRYIAEWTMREYGICIEKFAIAPSGVDVDRFTPRDGFLEPPSRLKVLFLGRLDPNKGPDITIDAVAALRKNGVPVDLTVAGGLWFDNPSSDDPNPFLNLLRSRMKDVDAVYLGHVTREAVPAVVRVHDVVCVLSRSQEPFGLVSLEAMASGCAVIASNRGGLPEACGGAAMLVDPDDFASVVGCLQRLATDVTVLNQQKRRSMARASLASWSTTADAIEVWCDPGCSGINVYPLTCLSC